MDDGLADNRLDALVAAILTSSRIDQGMSGAQCIREFKATLKALAKEGTAENLVVAARAAVLKAPGAPTASSAED